MKTGLMNIAATITRRSLLSIAAMFFLASSQQAAAERVFTTSETIEYASFLPGDDDELLTYGDDSIDAVEALTPKNALASYGPFHVTGADTAKMVGVVDVGTPAQFRKMLAAHPGIRKLVLQEVPGTEDDDANLALARMVRKQGMETIVPQDGSVRSGGVELFIAGLKRTAEPGAEFGVHSWQDDEGREAKDYPAGAPIHMAYLNFYREMGFTPEKAQDFYAFTNRSPFDSIHYMTRDEIARYQLTN